MNERTNERTIDTPWGHSQGIYPVIDGVTAHTTATHGGYQLSDDRQNNLEARGMPTVWCREWYEEDCEITAVILGFPSEFAPDVVRGAMQMVNRLKIEVGGTWSQLYQWADARREIKDRARMDHTVPTQCPMCSRSDEVHTIREDYDRWRNGLVIQEAMPYLSVTDREKLQTGICGPCWDLHMVPSDA